MTTDAQGAGTPLNHTREGTIDALCEHFANDAMTVEEFETRVDVAHRATSNEELRDLLRDLPSGDLPAVAGSASTAPAPVPGSLPAPSTHVKETGYAMAILGGTRRKGRWSPARVTHVVAMMGGVELDFREAALPPGLTELKVYSIMGGVEIIVPPGLAVESHGIGILGGFEHGGEGYGAVDPSAPVLRVSGLAMLGGVDIQVRYPGESKREARRRRRQERRDRRRELRGRIRDLADDVKRLGK